MSMSMLRAAGFFVAFVLAPACAIAQDDDAFDPQFELDDAAEPASTWQPFIDLRLRGDRVQGLPNGRADLERARGRLRVGAATVGDRWLAGVAVEAALGSDANRDNLRNNDVECSDAATIDEVWVEWKATDTLRLQAGKAALPMALSPMLWDADLRPTGVSLDLGGTHGLANRWQLGAGWFAPDPLGRDGARVAIVQAAWHWNEGAPWSGGVLLSHLRFASIDTLARAGLGRGNRIGAGAYLEDYRPVDLQLYLQRWHERWPLRFDLDAVRNPGADAERDGLRASARIGDRRMPHSWEFGWAWQRIRRDAVLAAVNDDDWWFHARTRGHMPWIGIGLDGTWSLRLAAFREDLDGTHERTRRLLLDAEARW